MSSTSPSSWSWVDRKVSRLLLPTKPPFSDSLSLRLRISRLLTSPTTVTRRLIMQKARGRGTYPLPPFVNTRFQVLFHPPRGVLFTFPSRYLSTIGLRGVFSLTGWSPRIQTGFLVSRPTQEADYYEILCRYGAFTRCGIPFQVSPVLLSHKYRLSYNPEYAVTYPV